MTFDFDKIKLFIEEHQGKEIILAENKTLDEIDIEKIADTIGKLIEEQDLIQERKCNTLSVQHIQCWRCGKAFDYICSEIESDNGVRPSWCAKCRGNGAENISSVAKRLIRENHKDLLKKQLKSE